MMQFNSLCLYSQKGGFAHLDTFVLVKKSISEEIYQKRFVEGVATITFYNDSTFVYESVSCSPKFSFSSGRYQLKGALFTLATLKLTCQTSFKKIKRARPFSSYDIVDLSEIEYKQQKLKGGKILLFPQ